MSLHEFNLRLASIADLEAILAVERATTSAPHWPESVYADILQAQTASTPRPVAPQRCIFVAQIASGPQRGIAGFAVGLIHHTETTAELESVAVAKSARRIGIGRALCTAIFDWSRDHGATSITLEVRAASAAAIGLYTSLGFVETGRRPRYYTDPADEALLMSKVLDDRHSPA